MVLVDGHRRFSGAPRLRSRGISRLRAAAPIAQVGGDPSTLSGKQANAKQERRQRIQDDLVVGTVGGLVSGIVVGLALFSGQLVVDNAREVRENAREERLVARQSAEDAERSEMATRLENLRFVRALSSDESIDRPLRGLDLEGMELAGLSLEGADFSNSNLRGVSFRNSNLSGAQFGGADVADADFTDAMLRGATFLYEGRNSDPSGAAPLSLAYADLTDSKFRRIMTWRQVDVSGSDFTNAYLEDIDWGDGTDVYTVFRNICPIGTVLPSTSAARELSVSADCGM